MSRRTYEDMWYLERPVSPTHPPMPLSDRAAQFAPFAALTGFGGLVDETGRFTEMRRDRDEALVQELDETLKRLETQIKDRPRVRLRLFREDGRKAGGYYSNCEGCVTKIDTEGAFLVLDDKEICFFRDILRLEPEKEREDEDETSHYREI